MSRLPLVSFYRVYRIQNPAGGLSGSCRVVALRLPWTPSSMPAAARTFIACGKCVWALAAFVFLFSVILFGTTFVRLIDVTILEWLETLAKTLAPSQRTMVTALTCVAGGFVVAWAFEISRQHGERPTIRTIVNSIKSSFVSFLWLLFNRSRRYSILVLACAALGSSSGAVPIGVFVRIVAVFLLRWAFVKLAARRHFALLSTWQSRTSARRSLPSSAPCTHVAFCITSRTTRTPTASRAAHGLSSRPRGLKLRSAAQFGTARSRTIKSFQARRGDTSW